MLEILQNIYKYMKDKPVQSFLIIVVLVLLGYYVYTKFFRKEHMEMKDMGIAQFSSALTLCLVCLLIPYLILYYIIKIANKNAIIETSQSKSK